jgi:hypothetical protein
MPRRAEKGGLGPDLTTSIRLGTRRDCTGPWLAKGGTLVVGYSMVNGIMTRLFQLIGFGNIDDHHVTAPKTIHRALGRVLRPVARKALPAFAPVSLALYQCAAWVKD